MKKKYIPCPETPDKITGNVSCDNTGYCPHGQICNIEIKSDAQTIASKWEYKFNNTMTDEDFENFRKEVNDAGLTFAEVWEHMEDYGNI